MVASHLADWENHVLDEFDLHDLTEQSNCFFTSQSLQTADLPRGDSWQWNQSRSKTKFSVSKELDVSFCKLNTRKSKGAMTRSPPYKVWIFQLYLLHEDLTLYFAWCEKGDKPTEQKIESKSINHNQYPIVASPPMDQIDSSPVYSSTDSSSPASSPLSSNLSSPSLDATPFGEDFCSTSDISAADASFLREFFDCELPLDMSWNNFGTEWCSFA